MSTWHGSIKLNGGRIMMRVIAIVIAVGTGVLPNSEAFQEEMGATLKLRQQVAEWKAVLQEKEIRYLDQRVAVVNQIHRTVLEPRDLIPIVSPEQAALLRSEIVPLLMEEMRRIERIEKNPPSKEWLWSKAEFLGEYKLDILRIIRTLADESTVSFLVEYLHTGRGVTDTLVRIGMPTTNAILERLKEDPRAYTGGLYAIRRIAEEELKRKNLQNLDTLRRIIVPELDRLCREDEAQQLALEYAQAQYRPESVGSMVKVFVEGIRESCSEDLPKIKAIVGLPTR